MPRLSEIEVQQLSAIGFTSYEKGDYECTIKCLLKVIDNEPRHWRAKLYLGMAYLKTGDRLLGTFQLRYLKTNCPDVDIQQRADKAMNTITPAAAAPVVAQPAATQPAAMLPPANNTGNNNKPSMERLALDRSGWLSAAEINSRRKKVECIVQEAKGRRYPLSTRNTIGKDQKNSIRVIEDKFISDFQAVITFEDSDYWIENSVVVNPTRVNGKPVTERTRLRPGDEIRMGQTTFKVE